MKSLQIIFLTLLAAVFVIAGFLTLRSSQMNQFDVDQVKGVPAGSHEVAWIASSTSTETWQRIVESAEYLEKQWPSLHGAAARLRVNTEQATLSLTAGVPEIQLWLEGEPENKILLRWYKASDEKGVQAWTEKLTGRSPPPLAVIGGESTRRAVWISNALEQARRTRGRIAPVFLITTATAVAYEPGKRPDPNAAGLGKKFFRYGPKLMEIYQDRCFRFSFTNDLMTRAVMDFIREHPELWQAPALPVSSNGAAAALGAGNPLAAALVLHAQAKYRYAMHTIAWSDDGYSLDLSERFLDHFKEWKQSLNGRKSSKSNGWQMVGENIISPVVGEPLWDPYKPTVQEEWSVHNSYIPDTIAANDIRQLLVLPADAARAGRFLRALKEASPRRLRNVVVLSGDSISFNNVYRDRKVMWNVKELPAPLVFFCHRNPVSADAGFAAEGQGESPTSVTATWDLLFYRDMLEAIVVAGWREGCLVADADAFNDAMTDLYWFEQHVSRGPQGITMFKNRNRREGSGEHLVCVVPKRQNGVAVRSDIMVWSRTGSDGGPHHWELQRKLANVSHSPVEVANIRSLEKFLKLP